MATVNGLNARQYAFVNGVLAGKSATKAYQDAYGCGQDCAERSASRLLRHVEVAKALETTRERLQQRTEITLERWLSEWALMGFSSVDDYDVDPMGGVVAKSERDPAVMRAVSAIKTRTTHFPDGKSLTESEFKLYDKQRALENIGKHMGFYPKEFGGEGSPNGRQGLSVEKNGAKTRITWGDLILEV